MENTSDFVFAKFLRCTTMAFDVNDQPNSLVYRAVVTNCLPRAIFFNLNFSFIFATPTTVNSRYYCAHYFINWEWSVDCGAAIHRSSKFVVSRTTNDSEQIYYVYCFSLCIQVSPSRPLSPTALGAHLSDVSSTHSKIENLKVFQSEADERWTLLNYFCALRNHGVALLSLAELSTWAKALIKYLFLLNWLTPNSGSGILSVSSILE